MPASIEGAPVARGTLHARIIASLEREGKPYRVIDRKRAPITVRLVDSDYVIPDELRIDRWVA